MKYRDLVEFDPIITIKVLREADDADRAAEDVRTFVISERMAEQLCEVILPNLQFEKPADNKGLLTVANYGTGKTHLMSVLSAVAEHPDLTPLLTNEEVAERFSAIAGRFHVIRAEIGATEMSLRDIVCTELERGLGKLSVSFKFPDASKVTNTKDSLIEMMTSFEAVYPDRGLLFVLDELLDYLRSRKDAELIKDLRFLREVGEICRSTRFRMIAGVQEAIFDNPRFAGVANEVKRVKERYEQIRISREDIAFVVKERLLRKTTGQRDQIRAHLQQFTPLYEGMAESLDEFVSLFPVHPAYLRTFERITAVEKREVLKTLSNEMTRLLDHEVPEDVPGLICYDSYRARLADDPSNRQIPEVREVLEKSEVLRSRVEKAMATPQYMPVALRIIDGLAVHRLTTDDIYVPIGATSKELRDDLCLLPENLPEREAFFLETTIDSIIGEIVKAVSGQFISEADDQVYLDVRKDIDYDQKIEDRAASLDDERLDEAYFKALEEVLERRETPYVAGYRIWEYELSWSDRNVSRFGYLFMGAPNERSTAQPPRDFYIYFLQPYDPPKFTDEEKADEVFFRLQKPNEDFTNSLRRYAGATALASESTATHRGIYDEKARAALQDMVAWLRAHMGEAVTVTYCGETKPLAVWLGAVPGPRGSVKEQVDTIAAAALADHFAARYPGYPGFGVEVTRANLPETIRQALAQVATTRPTALGTKALEALDLLDVHGNLVEMGEFAQALLNRLDGAGGKVLNRSEILAERDRGLSTWAPWHLEPAWLVVVASALTQLGRIEIGFDSGQIDALGLDRLTKMSLEEIEAFSHLAPPKALPVVQLREVAKLLDLPTGLVPNQGANEAAVQQFLTAANAILQSVVEVRAKVSEGVTLWGALVVERPEERDSRLQALQKLLENVRARNSVGKMNKLDVGQEAIDRAREGRAELDWVKAALGAQGHLAQTVEYLREASEVFGPSHPLSQDANRFRDELLALFRQETVPDASRVAELRKLGEDVRRRFAEEAARAHASDRLDLAGEQRKREIIEADLFQDLKQLSSISLLPAGAFGSLQNQLAEIGTCLTFDEAKLAASVICPECGYRPQASNGPSARALLDGIDDQLRRLGDEWASTLRDNLRTEEMLAQIELLAPTERTLVEEFVKSGGLPSPVTDEFVRALNQVFERFEVRKVTAEEVWGALFPEAIPTTAADLRDRFSGFLGKLGNGSPEEKLRIVPVHGEEPSS
jgi:hypothetical protein